MSVYASEGLSTCFWGEETQKVIVYKHMISMSKSLCIHWWSYYLRVMHRLMQQRLLMSPSFSEFGDRTLSSSWALPYASSSMENRISKSLLQLMQLGGHMSMFWSMEREQNSLVQFLSCMLIRMPFAQHFLFFPITVPATQKCLKAHFKHVE